MGQCSLYWLHGNNADNIKRPEWGRKKVNMKVDLVGLYPLDFSSKDGGQIKGINLECNFVDDSVYGKKADAKFISDIALKNLGITLEDLLPLINSEVDLELNFKGKVVGIKKLS